jgi:hypothetical protein
MWGSGISRDQLLQKISLLAMLGGVRDGLQAHSLTTSGDIEHGLTIEQEAEIAGNLAFLSRRRHDPKSVAAISIEQDGHGQGMIVRLCVNGGILSGVEEGLKQICALLEEISRCRKSLLKTNYKYAYTMKRIRRAETSIYSSRKSWN